MYKHSLTFAQITCIRETILPILAVTSPTTPQILILLRVLLPHPSPNGACPSHSFVPADDVFHLVAVVVPLSVIHQPVTGGE